MALLVGSLALGLCAGILSGMVGIGGGIVIVPALVLLLGFEQKTATGTSLFALLAPVGLLGVLAYSRAGHINVRAGMLIGFGLFCGVFLGARVGLALSDVALRRVLAVILVLAAVRLLTTR
ncbi:MAG: sulfite exporter TauE/SafE family protein [Frankia sp.]|nr:sulfite exporter TauE/SafE family protein [Frankia sp.]